MFFTKEEIDSLVPERIPPHVAIIPDGNRRWAKKQEMSVQKGHKEGADILMDVLRGSKEIGIKAVTFYTFSTENWLRPESEVDGLMWLIETYLKNELQTMREEGVRFNAIGDISRLPQSLQETIAVTLEETRKHDKIDLILALNYGARDELARACKSISGLVLEGKLQPQDIDEKMISAHLDTRRFPDPDLLIRTSGENRISNFLLWQLSYAEIYVTPSFWPDFTPHDLLNAVKDYQKRERRRGGDA